MTSYLPALLSYLLFALFHSLTAQEAFKSRLAKILSTFFVEYFWRLIYCVLSFYLLYLLAYYHIYYSGVPHSNRLLVQLPPSLDIIRKLLHLFSVFITYWAFIQINYFEFWGVKQFWNGLRILFSRYILRREWSPPKIMLAGVDDLQVVGIYKILRHPMLAGGFLFLLTLPPTQNNFVSLFFYTIYMFTGMHYEERRLIKHFGDGYREYQRNVGALFPKLWQRPQAG